MRRSSTSTRTKPTSSPEIDEEISDEIGDELEEGEDDDDDDEEKTNGRMKPWSIPLRGKLDELEIDSRALKGNHPGRSGMCGRSGCIARRRTSAIPRSGFRPSI